MQGRPIANPLLRRQLAKRGMTGPLGSKLIEVFTWVIDIPAASAIAAGGSVSDNTVQIPTSMDFIVHGIAAQFYRSTAPIGTPVALASAALTASNDMPFLGHLRMQVQTQSSQWLWWNKAARLDILTSNSLTDRPVWARPFVPGNDSLKVDIYNDSAVALYGQVLFLGAYYKR